jgi:hypothetical protein
MGELERSPRIFEGQWVGQFRAVDAEKARLFGQYIANLMEQQGVQDVGFSVREGSASEFRDDEGRISLQEDVPKSVIHESVSNEEVQRQLKEIRGGDSDN